MQKTAEKRWEPKRGGKSGSERGLPVPPLSVQNVAAPGRSARPTAYLGAVRNGPRNVEKRGQIQTFRTPYPGPYVKTE